MLVYNAEISTTFDHIADMLELQNANPFRIRAYRRAARVIAESSKSMESLISSGHELSELPGIGKDLARKIEEIIATGHCEVADELEKEFPDGLLRLMKIEGLGPKRVMKLHKELGINDPEDFRRAAIAGKIKNLKGFSETLEQKILHALEARGSQEVRYKWVEADEAASSIVKWLQNVRGVKKVAVAGSYRRLKDTVGDLDIIVSCAENTRVMARFIKYPGAKEILSQGSTRGTISLRNGMHVDLRVVSQDSYGAALYYFTGSKSHNIAVRKLAAEIGLKINEYGVYRKNKKIAGKTEEEVFASVGLGYIEPEMRENRGEIELARSGNLPQLITLADIRGDLHVHTDESDGQNSLLEMVQAAKKCGYEYFAITDHSRRVTIAHGLDEKRLRKECEKIDRLNENLEGLTILKSCEVDILEDGSLDLPDSVLKDLDLTVCSVHYKFDLSAERQTERIIRAMDNQYFNILAHPTGRLIGQRAPYALDLEKILLAAQERGCAVEINAFPDRLDLDDIHAHMAKDFGVKLSISTDAHKVDHLSYMKFGIAQSRRGWLEKDDVINTQSLRNLRKLLKR